MPNILKRFTKPSAGAYVFPEAQDLPSPWEESDPPEEPELETEEQTEDRDASPGQTFCQDPTAPIDYARIQAEAILAAAHEQAAAIREEVRLAAEKEQEVLREDARQQGFSRGYAEGVASGAVEARQRLEEQAEIQSREIKEFLDAAAREKDKMIDQTKEDLKELALVIAEKVIRVSLKSSGDILLRMIDAATEKHRRCEWVQIYLADCDVKNLSCTVPQLASALRHVSDRVRVIPMADDESGTCIIEMPDEIIDASVSTQLDNLRGVISNAEPDRN